MKRIIAVLICLCIILTGCHNKNDNNGTDQSSNDITQTVTPEITGSAVNGSDVVNNDTDSNTNSNSNTITNLLTLNEAWSLVKTAELDQADYIQPKVKADVKSYTIAGDLSNIENINQFAGFSDDQVQMLVNNGFVVLPSGDLGTYGVYEENEYEGVPNFITSDSVLHIYHQFYDKSLMCVEGNYLYQDLDQMTKQMLDKSIVLLQMLTDEDLKALQKKNIVYFLVARMLFLQSTDVGVTVDPELLDLAKQEFNLAQVAGGKNKFPLLNVDIDYSQFTVRGHYTRTEELGKYFKTMMWFGLIPFSLADKNKDVLYDDVYQALLIAYTTVANSEGTCDAELWSDIYDPTVSYVGLSDDVNVLTINGLRSSVFGENEDPNIINDEEYHDKLTEAVKALPEPQIQAKLVSSSIPTGKQFRFMGQRYILDSDILQNLMDSTYRVVPTSLDVMGVLGSNTAEDLLFNVYRPQDTWTEYTDRYQKLKDRVSGYHTDYWETNLYSGWLWSLQEELKEYDSNSGMPFFMTNDAWKKKSLNTALGSYTELKHDTVLYGKQGMAECGGDEAATAQEQFVEPDIGLYSKLLYLTDFTCSVLDKKGMLNDRLKSGAKSYEDYLKLLVTCSGKELQNRPLLDEEIRQLRLSGGTMESIINDCLAGAVPNDDPNYEIIDTSDMLVTDIATCGGRYLSLGTGYFDNIYVVFPYDGKLYLSRGSVYSTYEFLSGKRLTDEEWWALNGLTINHSDYGDSPSLSEQSGEMPKQADWIKSFKSDSNNVTITSLEVIWEKSQE